MTEQTKFQSLESAIPAHVWDRATYLHEFARPSENSDQAMTQVPVIG